MSDRVSFYNFVTSGDGTQSIATPCNNGGLPMKTRNAYEFAGIHEAFPLKLEVQRLAAQ